MKHLYTFYDQRAFRSQLSVIAVVAMILSGSGVSAQSVEQYTDVQNGVWYEQAADALLNSGALDESESRLRPNDLATRAEMAKLLVLLNDRNLTNPTYPSFNDVSRSAWYYTYMETAAQAGWFRGDSNCYGQNSSRCSARPLSTVNRAEMAIILQRAFALSYTNNAPVFPDNTEERVWYFLPVQTAADHCVLQGDDISGRVRPASSMNRAEMIVMSYRASLNMQYHNDCDTQTDPVGDITGVQSISSSSVQVTFNVDLDDSRMDDTSAYAVETVGGAEINVSSVTVLNSRTVKLSLASPLIAGATHRVSVQSMRTKGGAVFNDTRTFVFVSAQVDPFIETVTATSTTMVRVRFSENMEPTRVDDATAYRVLRENGGGEVNVQNVIIVNSTTVDLVLQSSLQSQVSYRLSAEDIRTDGGEEFSDEATFISSIVTAPQLESASFVSSTKLRLHFSQDLNEASAEQEFRYRVTGFSGDMDIGSAILTNPDEVELSFDATLEMQQEYIVTVTGVSTVGNIPFSDQLTFIYAPTGSNKTFKAMLKGINEVPMVSTTAVGTGSFTLTASGLAYDIVVSGISASAITAAHFHGGDIGVEGEAIESISFEGGLHAAGTWTDLSLEERANILEGDIYVNIHSATNPDGEIRGQLVLQP